MNRKLILALVAAPVVAASVARGQPYVANVLYPFTIPAGLPSPALLPYENILCDNTGNTIATMLAGEITGSQPLYDALFWPGTSSGVVLNPPGSDLATYVESVQGSQQVGQYDGYAYLWSGSAASGTFLNPFGTNPLLPTASEAFGTNGTQQVGYAVYPTRTGSIGPQATFWEGTAASLVNLGSGSVESEAVGTDGSQQVGSVGASNTDYPSLNAALWSGSAASLVNLNPSQWVDSWAVAVSNGQQVGYGEIPGTNPELSLQYANPHALLWQGSAASYIDLNPAGFNLSYALGTNGTQQVGWGGNETTGLIEALVWNGSPNSYVDLEGLLPSTDTWDESRADSIDANGNIYGWAVDSSGNYFAVEWSAVSVPEPTSLAILAVAGAKLLSRQSRHPAD